MRAREFINEEINSDIYHPNFKHEVEMLGYRYVATVAQQSGYGNELKVTVYDGNKEIAHVEFIEEPHDKALISANTWVDDSYEGQGIATNMYAYAKMLGNDIMPSDNQTDAGERMWRSWNQSGQSKHILPKGHKGYNDLDEGVKKNRWALIVSDPEKHQWSDNLIELVNNAYQNTSLGSFVQNAGQVAASDWVALDWDPQPDLDCTVFYRKARPNEHWSGYKIQGIGHDGKPESKQKVIARVKALLTKPGTWIESSDAMARTLGNLGLQPVTDEQVLNTLFPSSNLTMLDQSGNYQRDVGGTRIREQVFGNPIVKG